MSYKATRCKRARPRGGGTLQSDLEGRLREALRPELREHAWISGARQCSIRSHYIVKGVFFLVLCL